MIKNIFTSVLLAIIFVSCEQKQEFIEITKGEEMDPKVSRIGIQINNRNEVYICKEIIENNERTGRYDFYRYKNHINFDYFKNKFLKLYKDTLEVPKVSDGEYNLLSYKLNNKNYKAIIFTDILSNEQRDVFYEIINLSRKKPQEKIIFHKFETKLLLEKN
ncbi:hypothetical protein [Elizabethkingia anophelis]|uniref:Lipoprotein n=1 Tax=Elizabethkingia anophelis NUHP1 TaxID=1338011 RepID=A0A077EGQ1_9FLAO|nr:hypothetical protein [Elizabethkingia anophelis]AIL46816.1 hypothetical protein BD94_3041 [Elizabethkingia anophelis NUHP1]KFC39448.1 hypothetical protein FF18_09420 [Elizabethkingia anophelis]MBE9391808.1 hypothetical protein [Elizabethkingia anophelis]MBE9405248.1 hypothetical protein [Elizabethkingia anophelis]MCL1035521.1 hypothetical protein [Elizabethkingia anophelis]